MPIKTIIKFKRSKKLFKEVMDIVKRNNADIIGSSETPEYNTLILYMTNKTDQIYLISNLMVRDIEIIKEENDYVFS